MLLRDARQLRYLDLSWNSLLTTKAISTIVNSCPLLDDLSVAGFPLFFPPASDLNSTTPNLDRERAGPLCARLLLLCVQKIHILLTRCSYDGDDMPNVPYWFVWLAAATTRRLKAPDVLARYECDTVTYFSALHLGIFLIFFSLTVLSRSYVIVTCH